MRTSLLATLDVHSLKYLKQTRSVFSIHKYNTDYTHRAFWRRYVNKNGATQQHEGAGAVRAKITSEPEIQT